MDASEIEVRIGTTWIEPEDYEQFIYELLGTPNRARAVRSSYYSSGIQIKYNADGKIGCQLVFSDIGTPKATWSEDWEELFKQGERTFDVYNYIKTELVKKGIPAEEIAFVHDAKTDAQRDGRGYRA